jgi:hypothetical protein
LSGIEEDDKTTAKSISKNPIKTTTTTTTKVISLWEKWKYCMALRTL